LLYNVPNFLTKQNLLNLFLADEEVFTKSAVFVNNTATAEKVYQSLHRRMNEAVGYLNPPFFDVNGYNTVDEFKTDPQARVMLVVTERDDDIDLNNIPFLIHFDVPQDIEIYIKRVAKTNEDDETIALTFATDMDMSVVKKIEQATGNKMEPSALPEDLVVVNEPKSRTEPTKQSTKNEEPEAGAAFHEKKASNNKNYNYSASRKAEMNKKKKHG
jgi:superfamily II DNA/RNA helicase